jgi:hypothetical protein
MWNVHLAGDVSVVVHVGMYLQARHMVREGKDREGTGKAGEKDHCYLAGGAEAALID